MFMKSFWIVIFSFFSCFTLYAQQEKGIYGLENWLDIWAEFTPESQVYKTPTQILSGNITSDTRLSKKETYLLLGNVFVTDSTSLTIEPGTVILGDYKSKGSLIVSNGSKIIAIGTQTDPIIFSSSRPLKKKGDWGGIFILGNAPLNKIGEVRELDFGLNPIAPEIMNYGGNDIASDSGVIKYVRIEYAGKRTKQYGYFNGLTLAGVGNKTVIENVMVTYCLGNSFTVIGGDTNLSRRVAFRSYANDFIFNNGARSQLTNSLAVKSPYYTSSGVASSIYLASNTADEDKMDPERRRTTLTAENITLLNLSDDLNTAIEIGLVKEALYVEKGTSFSIQKSVFSGFSPAVILSSDIDIDTNSLNKMEFSNMYFNNCKGNIFTNGESNNEDLENWYGNGLFKNVYSKGADFETFIEPVNIHNLDFRLQINKIIAINLLDDE